VIIRERGRKEEKRRGGGGPVKGNDVVVNPPFVLRLGIYRLRPGLVVVVTHRKKKTKGGFGGGACRGRSTNRRGPEEWYQLSTGFALVACGGFNRFSADHRVAKT
jgi:hypothetical protein